MNWLLMAHSDGALRTSLVHAPDDDDDDDDDDNGGFCDHTVSSLVSLVPVITNIMTTHCQITLLTLCHCCAVSTEDG